MTKQDGTLLALGAVALVGTIGELWRRRGSRAEGGDIDVAQVNLKRSAWSADESAWEEREPGLWKRMYQAYRGEAPPIEIHSSPSKEIRYGEVLIEKGRVDATFSAEWHDLGSFVPDEIQGEEEVDLKKQEIRAWLSDHDMLEYGEIKIREGADFEWTGDFYSFMAAIDAVEARLLEKDRDLWKRFDREIVRPRISFRNPKRLE